MLEITVGRHAHLSLEATGKFPSFRSMAVAHSCRGRSCGLVRPNTRKCTPLARSKTRTFFNRVGSAGLREHPGEFDEGTPSWNVTILFVRPPHIRSHPAEQVTLEPRWFLFWPCLSNVLPLARMANG
jgi:hypothetical protein